MSSGPAPSLRQRWALVRARLGEESRRASYAEKLAQLESLASSVDDFGWREKLGDDDDRVRALWVKLRQSASHG